MMNHEFIEALDELEKDRGIDKDILTYTNPLLTLATSPVTISFSFSINSLYTISLSASLILWTTTCLAVWAAILPKSLGVTSFSIISPNS